MNAQTDEAYGRTEELRHCDSCCCRYCRYITRILRTSFRKSPPCRCAMCTEHRLSDGLQKRFGVAEPWEDWKPKHQAPRHSFSAAVRLADGTIWQGYFRRGEFKTWEGRVITEFEDFCLERNQL